MRGLFYLSAALLAASHGLAKTNHFRDHSFESVSPSAASDYHDADWRIFGTARFNANVRECSTGPTCTPYGNKYASFKNYPSVEADGEIYTFGYVAQRFDNTLVSGQNYTLSYAWAVSAHQDRECRLSTFYGTQLLNVLLFVKYAPAQTNWTTHSFDFSPETDDGEMEVRFSCTPTPNTTIEESAFDINIDNFFLEDAS